MLEYGFTNPKDAEFAQAVLAEKESRGESTKGYFEEIGDKVKDFAKNIADKAVNLVKKVSEFFTGIFDSIFGWIYKKALDLEIWNPIGENFTVASILPDFMKRSYERAYKESGSVPISESTSSTLNNTASSTKVSSAQPSSVKWDDKYFENLTGEEYEKLSKEERKILDPLYEDYLQRKRNNNINISSNIQTTPSQQNANMVGSIKIADAPNVFTNMLSVLQKIEQNTRINYTGVGDRIKNSSNNSSREQELDRLMDGPEVAAGTRVHDSDNPLNSKQAQAMLNNMKNMDAKNKSAHPLYNIGQGAFNVSAAVLKASKDL